MKHSLFYRILFYIIGLLILALGLTLNTKTGLGVSPIISVAYSTSVIFNYDFGNTTFALYALFVIIQIILHFIREFSHRADSPSPLVYAKKHDWKLILLMDCLQLPLSLIFTRFLNLFSIWIPDLYIEGGSITDNLTVRLLILIIAIILTGIGAAMSLNMRIVPNPGDGIVQAISDTIHKNVGFTKNCFDLFNISATVILSLLLSGHLTGVGIGTLLAMVGVGRTIALFNHFTLDKMKTLAGIEY